MTIYTLEPRHTADHSPHLPTFWKIVNQIESQPLCLLCIELKAVVYRKLEGTFSDEEDATKQGFLDELEDEDRRVLMHPARTMSTFGVSSDGPKRRPAKHVRPATKGAFGKPKHLRR